MDVKDYHKLARTISAITPTKMDLQNVGPKLQAEEVVDGGAFVRPPNPAAPGWVDGPAVHDNIEGGKVHKTYGAQRKSSRNDGRLCYKRGEGGAWE